MESTIFLMAPAVLARYSTRARARREEYEYRGKGTDFDVRIHLEVSLLQKRDSRENDFTAQFFF